jgi:hypothetical protein
MGKPTILERASKYVAVMPPSLSGSGGHNAAFAAACALVKGFNLSVNEARGVMAEFNGRCVPPWNERELEHKLTQADKTPDDQPRGYLIGDGKHELGEVKERLKPKFQPAAKIEYDVSALRSFSGLWAGVVDLIWLANRSAIDPATLDAAGYLEALYGARERVVVFDNEYSQGCAVWPYEAAKIPSAARCGVWYLAQPVDGEYHPNPRNLDKEGRAKMSRRSEEAVTAWRYLVIESDEAPLMLWLGALARLPLRISAIYTSGSRSIHALVRVDARTKEHWDAIKAECFGQHAPAGRFLIRNGADKGVLSGVRLTRLPGCYRQGKMVDAQDGKQNYVRFEPPVLQKLLYIDPEPDSTPLVDKLSKRDVVRHWMWLAECGVGDSDESDGHWLREGLSYYAPRSEVLAQALQRMESATV